MAIIHHFPISLDLRVLHRITIDPMAVIMVAVIYRLQSNRSNERNECRRLHRWAHSLRHRINGTLTMATIHRIRTLIMDIIDGAIPRDVVYSVDRRKADALRHPLRRIEHWFYPIPRRHR